MPAELGEYILNIYVYIYIHKSMNIYIYVSMYIKSFNVKGAAMAPSSTHWAATGASLLRRRVGHQCWEPLLASIIPI